MAQIQPAGISRSAAVEYVSFYRLGDDDLDTMLVKNE